MGGLDAPRLRIEVVGAIADILHGSEGEAFVADSDDTARDARGQYEGLATEVFEGLRVREVDF